MAVVPPAPPPPLMSCTYETFAPYGQDFWHFIMYIEIRVALPWEIIDISLGDIMDLLITHYPTQTVEIAECLIKHTQGESEHTTDFMTAIQCLAKNMQPCKLSLPNHLKVFCMCSNFVSFNIFQSVSWPIENICHETLSV